MASLKVHVRPRYTDGAWQVVVIDEDDVHRRFEDTYTQVSAENAGKAALRDALRQWALPPETPWEMLTPD